MLSTVFFAGQCRDVGLLVDMADISMCGSMSELAAKLAPTHPHLQSSESTEQNQVSIPFTQLQNLYSIAGLSQALIWDAKSPMTRNGATELLEWLVERHPVLGATLELNEEKSHLLTGTTASPSGALVPYESDEKCTTRVKELQLEVSKSHSKTDILTVVFFGEASQIRKIGFVAPSGALDARSWQIILQDIQEYSSRSQQLSVQQTHTFSDWVGEEQQRTGGEREAGRAQDSSVESTQTPQKLRESGSTSSSTVTLSLEATESLYDEKCHQTLRTEVSDLLFASLAAAFRDQLPDQTRYLEIRDARPQDDGDSWNTVIGCFDELSEVPYQSAGDVLHVARSAKDARRRSFLSSIDSDSKHHGLIFDRTQLSGKTSSSDSTRSHNEGPRQGVGEFLAQSLSGLYVSPFWTGKRLSFLVVCDAKLGGEAQLKASSDAFVLHLQKTVARLTESGPLPTLSDFPYITMDYPSLDRVYEQKLQHIAKEPMAEIENIYPCSPIQENILVASALDKGAYTCAFTVRISTSGPFASCDSGRWVTAWNKVVEKHSGLRTVFIESEGRQGYFDQVVLHKVVPRVEIIASGTTPPEVEFPPLEAPHHLTVGQAGPGQFLLVLTISHAITDGHSAEVILSDMCGHVAGQSDKGEKVLSYADYVVDQHLSLEISVSDYWRKYLQKTQETHLPVARAKAGLSSFETVKSTMPINVKSIDRLCQQHNINLANVCQFAWGVVLRSYLGVDDVCFSYISSVRNVPLKGIMTAVGPLITTLLCSMNLEGETNVIEAVKAVNADYLESLAHEAELSEAVSTRRWSNTVMSFRRRLVQDDESLPGLSCKIVKGLSPTNVSQMIIVQVFQN